MRKKIGIIFIFLVLLVIAFNLITQIMSALKAGDRLTQAAQRLEEVEVKNKELKKQLQEASSQEFIERQARDKLGLARDGETVVVIPDEKIRQVLGEAKISIEEHRLPNPLGWFKLFFN